MRRFALEGLHQSLKIPQIPLLAIPMRVQCVKTPNAIPPAMGIFIMQVPQSLLYTGQARLHLLVRRRSVYSESQVPDPLGHCALSLQSDGGVSDWRWIGSSSLDWGTSSQSYTIQKGTPSTKSQYTYNSMGKEY